MIIITEFRKYKNHNFLNYMDDISKQAFKTSSDLPQTIVVTEDNVMKPKKTMDEGATALQYDKKQKCL